MEKDIAVNPRAYSPLVLAYLGDAYIELLTRSCLIKEGDNTTSELTHRSKAYVTAVAQSAAVETLIPLLNDTELEYYKRGRNAKSNHTPKSAAVIDYRRSTGLESLFGYLYLTGKVTRAQELFDLCFNGNQQK